MPHQRPRFAETILRKQASFWPVLGVLGMRQVGKSTLLRDRLGIVNYLTLDEDPIRSEAEASVQSFIARNEHEPTVIDEVQKVPKLFDAIKAQVDRNKRPGQWYISGSVAFSEKIGIRESLTGRIGLLHLYPMTLAETRELPLLGKPQERCRLKSQDIARQMDLGGLPIPAFIRDQSVREAYWRGWVETTLLRDASKAYGRGFDAEICLRVVRQLARVLVEGEYPSLAALSGDKRTAKKYIQALENIFFLRRFTVHEHGVGNDHWVFGDSGLAAYLAQFKHGEGMLLSLVRHYVLNEIFSYYEYQGKPLPRLYYKSLRGAPIDLLIDDMPIKIVAETVNPVRLGWHERALAGAMKKLKKTKALLVAPIDQAYLPKKGIGVVPWSYWS